MTASKTSLAAALVAGLAISTLTACGSSHLTTQVQSTDQAAYNLFVAWIDAYAAQPDADAGTVTKLRNALGPLQAAINAYNAAPSPNAQTAIDIAISVLLSITPPSAAPPLPAPPTVAPSTVTPSPAAPVVAH